MRTIEYHREAGHCVSFRTNEIHIHFRKIDFFLIGTEMRHHHFKIPHSPQKVVDVIVELRIIVLNLHKCAAVETKCIHN